jgi:hypothetical protein
MKKLFLSTVAVAATFALTACVSEDQNLAPNEAGKGYIALNVTNDDALTTRTVQNAPATWTVALTGQATVNSTVGDIGDQPLAEGTYNVNVYNYASLDDALEGYGNAYYTGSQTGVAVTAGSTTPVSIEMGKAKNAKFTIQSNVPESAAITITAAVGSSRTLTFTKAANATAFDYTEAFFGATDEVTINVTYNNVALATAKTLTMKGAGTENKLIISTNGNGKISLTIKYDDEFETGNSETITFDALTGQEL